MKVFETRDAVLNGADEIDLVISIGALKEGAQQTWKTRSAPSGLPAKDGS